MIDLLTYSSYNMQMLISILARDHQENHVNADFVMILMINEWIENTFSS